MAYPLQPLLFAMDPERAHRATIQALRLRGALTAPKYSALDLLPVRVAGIDFPNPVGLAAGLDKDGEAVPGLFGLGFGFVEVGTLTPRPQAGNPKPRLFRLVEDEAVINRFGFNNEGHEPAFARLSAIRAGGIIGVNIGANKDSADRIADYVAGIRRFHALASYFTANISSPNTPGLRDLQARESLAALLSAVIAARDEEAAKSGRRVPVFLKIAPDLTEEGMDDIAAEVLAHKLDGLIVSNTTLSRDGLVDQRQAGKAGGLSGKPLFARSTAVLARMRRRVGSALPIIGVGGVSSAETALEKIRAGADLVQLYSGMVYGGPGLAGEVVSGLSTLLDREQVGSVRDLRDSRVDHWAAAKL
jgi:dihydroorotate dehydrogenase